MGGISGEDHWCSYVPALHRCDVFGQKIVTLSSDHDEVDCATFDVVVDHIAETCSIVDSPCVVSLLEPIELPDHDGVRAPMGPVVVHEPHRSALAAPDRDHRVVLLLGPVCTYHILCCTLRLLELIAFQLRARGTLEH